MNGKSDEIVCASLALLFVYLIVAEYELNAEASCVISDVIVPQRHY